MTINKTGRSIVKQYSIRKLVYAITPEAAQMILFYKKYITDNFFLYLSQQISLK